LVIFDKSDGGTDKIKNHFEGGINISSNAGPIIQYKSLILHVGFNEKKHGYIDPVNTALTGENSEGIGSYRPMPFYPTDPPDPNAHKCNIILTKTSDQRHVMFTEEGELIEDKTIIEFRFDSNKLGAWRWIPLRVRYDKTAELRQGGDNYGNAYHTANNNWYSIHYPITIDKLTDNANATGISDDQESNADVYYNTNSNHQNKDITKPLRDFHNLWIKQRLIHNVSREGDTLIDYSVGKGGDLPKWINAKLSFVFGVDISKDNIENRLDGVYARYLNFKGWQRNIPDALFVNGDSSKNIQNGDAMGDAMGSENYRRITAAVMGQGQKDKTILDRELYNNFGKGEHGFNISSCQFSVHYFFENITILTGFLRNLSECTKQGGYFIGTCYDGASLFDYLNDVSRGGVKELYKRKQKIWEVTKQYDSTEFENNAESLGLAIDVFQESINKTATEYLVNFEYFKILMEDYGFRLIDVTEAKTLGFPQGSASFKDLFDDMVDRKANGVGSAKSMSPEEKTVSFFGRYFIFIKTRNINCTEMGNILINKVASDNEASSAAVNEPNLPPPPPAVTVPSAPIKLNLSTRTKTKPVSQTLPPPPPPPPTTLSAPVPASAPPIKHKISIRKKPESTAPAPPAPAPTFPEPITVSHAAPTFPTQGTSSQKRKLIIKKTR
jgi:hypothetical protein